MNPLIDLTRGAERVAFAPRHLILKAYCNLTLQGAPFAPHQFYLIKFVCVIPGFGIHENAQLSWICESENLERTILVNAEKTMVLTVAMLYTILQFLFGGYSCGLRSEETLNFQIIFCPQLDQRKKNCASITQYFKQKGYITVMGSGSVPTHFQVKSNLRLQSILLNQTIFTFVGPCVCLCYNFKTHSVLLILSHQCIFVKQETSPNLQMCKKLVFLSKSDTLDRSSYKKKPIPKELPENFTTEQLNISVNIAATSST